MAKATSPPSTMDKLEAFTEINNTMTKICHAADESINTGKPVTKEQMCEFLTEDITWTFLGEDNKEMVKAGVFSFQFKSPGCFYKPHVVTY